MALLSAAAEMAQDKIALWCFNENQLICSLEDEKRQRPRVHFCDFEVLQTDDQVRSR